MLDLKDESSGEIQDNSCCSLSMREKAPEVVAGGRIILLNRQHLFNKGA